MTPARRWVLAAAALLAAVSFCGFVALGIWQLERRAWKHALIQRVEQRVHAAPVAPPAPAEWPQLSMARDEYRRVRLAGHWLHEAEALVQASTELGSGWWVVTPLRQADGTVVLVNRGYVPPQRRERGLPAVGNPAGNPAEQVVVVGLLRISEPGGGFLRRNQPSVERWFSRDVAAIAAARGLHGVAPYFVDAQAGPAPDPEGPVAGLTVISFRDNHLVYALTWLALAAMVLALAVMAVRLERCRPQPDP